MVSARIGWSPPSLYNPRLKDRLFRVTTPTLLVSAAGDRLVPTVSREVYQAGLPDAEIVLIADAAHAVWAYTPNIWQTSSRDFCSKAQADMGAKHA